MNGVGESSQPVGHAQAFMPLPDAGMRTPDELRDAARKVFDRIAALYDEARPGYPKPLFEDLGTLCGLGPSTRVIEIGCGTGQATRDLASHAGAVRCIEPGENLAALARRNLAVRERDGGGEHVRGGCRR